MSYADDLAAPCYPLRSCASYTNANSVIDTKTEQALKYHHLSRGPNKDV